MAGPRKTAQKQRIKIAGTVARESARTAGHQARLDASEQARKQSRANAYNERRERQKFEGSIPIWGAKDPTSGEYRFRPGAKEGWWEKRAMDWTGPQRGAAEGQADWTKIHHATTARQPSGYGFLSGKVVGAIGNRLNQPAAQPQQQQQGLPPPQQPPQYLPPGGGGGGGGQAPGQGQQGPQGPRQHNLRMQPKPTSGNGITPAVMQSRYNAMNTQIEDAEVMGELGPGTPELPSQKAIGTRKRGPGRQSAGANYSRYPRREITSGQAVGTSEGPDPLAAGKARLRAQASGEVNISPADERLRYSAPDRFRAQASVAHAKWQKTSLGSPYASMFPEE